MSTLPARRSHRRPGARARPARDRRAADSVLHADDARGRSGARARCAAAGRRRSASRSSAGQATTAAMATCWRGSRARSGCDVVVIALARARDGCEGDARRAHDDFVAAGGAVGAWHEDCSARRGCRRRCDLRHRACRAPVDGVDGATRSRDQRVRRARARARHSERLACRHRRGARRRGARRAHDHVHRAQARLLSRRGPELHRRRHVR